MHSINPYVCSDDRWWAVITTWQSLLKDGPTTYHSRLDIGECVLTPTPRHTIYRLHTFQMVSSSHTCGGRLTAPIAWPHHLTITGGLLAAQCGHVSWWTDITTTSITAIPARCTGSHQPSFHDEWLYAGVSAVGGRCSLQTLLLPIFIICMHETNMQYATDRHLFVDTNFAPLALLQYY